MDDRKNFILGAVLRSYINSAEPIGSRSLQRDYDLKISAATIRNEMSDLEHLGYLMKAHTSSGRIPSPQAYRWYVDEIQSQGITLPKIPALVDKSLLHQSSELKNIMDTALEILAQSTNYASFALLPARSDDKLESLELIQVSDQEILLVMVYHSRMVKTDLIYLKGNYNAGRIRRAKEVLQGLLVGKELSLIDNALHSYFFSSSSLKTNLLAEVVPIIQKQIRESLEPSIAFKGLSRLYEIEDYGTWDETSAFIGKLTNSDDFVDLLSDKINKDIEIYIGDESNISFLSKSSIIVAPFQVSDSFKGKIGVIGPTRMQYQKVLFDVAMIGRYIGSIAAR